MPKKKKPSIIWRATKATARGVYKSTIATSRYLSNKFKENREKARLNKNPVYTTPPNREELILENEISGDFRQTIKILNQESVIGLIFGKRGSGKSALGFRILENIHSLTNRPCYVLGIQQKLMPKWISPIDKVEGVPDQSAVLVDEGAISFSSRQSMKSSNLSLSKLLAIARHKNLSLFFITQNTGMIDKNILKLSDMLLIKEGSLLQLEMERPEMKKFYEKAKNEFSKLKGDKRQYVYTIDDNFEGVISHALPSFWTEDLSKSHAQHD